MKRSSEIGNMWRIDRSKESFKMCILELAEIEHKCQQDGVSWEALCPLLLTLLESTPVSLGVLQGYDPGWSSVFPSLHGNHEWSGSNITCSHSFLSPKQSRPTSWAQGMAMSIGHHHLGVPKAPQIQPLQLNSLSLVPVCAPSVGFLFLVTEMILLPKPEI